jgi:hypothetical protein
VNWAKRAGVLFAGLLVIGVAGYLIYFHQWIRYVFAHLGGLAIMGFLGLLAGTIAANKGHGHRRAFLLGFALPILLGILAVVIVHGSGGRGCGGIVSLAVSFVVIVFYSLAGNKTAG